MKSLFATLLLSLTAAASLAQTTSITVSSNNTPGDRKALEEISKEAFQRIGVKFNLVSLPSERSLQSANAGDVDGEGLRVAGLSERYPDLIQVPERFIRISFVAFGKDKSVRLDKGWDSLNGKSVVFINGWKLFEANTGAARVTKVDKPDQLFKMVGSARADLALYTLADGVALLREMGINDIAPLSPSLQESDMYLYLHKKHAALVPKLAQTLREMKSDGSLNRIVTSLQ